MMIHLLILGSKTSLHQLILVEKYLKNEENEEKRVKIAQEIKQLVLPGTMGEVFKVMALSKKQSVKLDGFKELDLTNRL